MPVWTDNYTTIRSNKSFSSYKWFDIYYEPIFTSIIVDFNQHIGLNKRIQLVISQFSSLEDGWDMDNSPAPSKDIIQKAHFLSNLLERHGQPIYHAAPGPSGEIMLDIRNARKSKSIEIIFYVNRSKIVFFPEEGAAIQNKFELARLPEYLSWINTK